MAFLTVSGVSKEGSEGVVLQDVSFSVQQFQKVAIAGETGSGKSTLLKVIAGLAATDSGEVIFEGSPITSPRDTLVPGQEGIAYLSQHFELPKFLRVEQVLDYVNLLPGHDAAVLYDICRIGHLLKRKTDQLSGGERQRIALAKLLISKPRLFLLDEPFSNLDMGHKTILKAVIDEAGQTLGTTFMLVSHEPADTLPWADQILVLQDSRLIQQGTPEDIYQHPVNEYTAALFGAYTRFGDQRDGLPATFATKAFYRPEDFQIVAQETPGALAGIVKKVFFLGSHTEVSIAAPNAIIRARVGAQRLVTGQKVWILA